MNSNDFEGKLEILEKEAEDIENLAIKLINSAPSKYSSYLGQYVFRSLQDDLIKLQLQVISKYNTWYNVVYPLIKQHLPHQLDEFKRRYQTKRGGSSSYDIIKILELKVSYNSGDKASVTNKFLECFTYQKSQLLSLKKINIKDTSKQLSSLNQLEESLVQNIYDYLLKNPTIFHTKSASISMQKKRAVKKRDKNICQICEKLFSEKELEVDHIFPHSLGGSNQITNLMALCKPCNKDKNNRLEYYKSDEGKQKLQLIIREFVKDLLLIHNFGEWLKKAGDARRKKVVLIAEKEKEPEDIEGKEYEDVYIVREEPRRPNIKLIETYLEFANDSEISSEDLCDRFDRIYFEVDKYINLRDINEEEEKIGVTIIQTICKNLLIQKKRYLLNQFHEILYRLSKIDIFIKPLKSNCLNTFLQFYKEKNYYSYLIDILNNCGYFTNVENEILHAIDDRNYDLLKKFKAISFSAYKREGIALMKALLSKQKEISDSEDPELKVLIRKIIKKIENNMFF